MLRHRLGKRTRLATTVRQERGRGIVEALEPRRLLSVSFGQGVALPGMRSNYVAVGDLNGDGKPDIVAVGTDANTGTTAEIGVYVNDGGGTFAAAIFLPYPGSSDHIGAVAIGDFNGDGVPDIAVQDNGDASVIVYLGAGTNMGGSNPSFLSPVTTAFGNAGDGVGDNLAFSVGHFGGSSADLVVWDQAKGGIVVLPSSGQGHFGTPIPIVNSQLNLALQNISTFVVADFSGDGISDIAYGVGSNVYVQLGASGGSFLTNAFSYAVPNTLIEQISAGVLTTGGKPDITVFNDTLGGASDVSVLLNNGAGSFGAAANYPVADGVYETLGDFNGDGSLDVAVRDPGVGVQVLTNSGTGTFGAATAVDLPVDTANLVAADLNADGKADLVVPDTIGLGAGTVAETGVFVEGASGGGGGGGTTTGSLGGSLSGSVPSNVIAGQKVKLNQNLTVTNDASSTVSGTATATLYLSSDGSIDASSVRLGSLSKRLKLKPHARIAFSLKVPTIPSSVPNGTYDVVAQITDPVGATSDATAGGKITVAPPQIDLSGTFSKQPVAGKNGKTALTFTVGDMGNTAATGTLTVNVDRSPDALLSDATVITTPSKKINIKPGKSAKITDVVTLPAGSYYLVINLDPSDAFHDVNLANNVFHTAAILTVS